MALNGSLTQLDYWLALNNLLLKRNRREDRVTLRNFKRWIRTDANLKQNAYYDVAKNIQEECAKLEGGNITDAQRETMDKLFGLYRETVGRMARDLVVDDTAAEGTDPAPRCHSVTDCSVFVKLLAGDCDTGIRESIDVLNFPRVVVKMIKDNNEGAQARTRQTCEAEEAKGDVVFVPFSLTENDGVVLGDIKDNKYRLKTLFSSYYNDTPRRNARKKVSLDDGSQIQLPPNQGHNDWMDTVSRITARLKFKVGGTPNSDFPDGQRLDGTLGIAEWETCIKTAVVEALAGEGAEHQYDENDPHIGIYREDRQPQADLLHNKITLQRGGTAGVRGAAEVGREFVVLTNGTNSLVVCCFARGKDAGFEAVASAVRVVMERMVNSVLPNALDDEEPGRPEPETVPSVTFSNPDDNKPTYERICQVVKAQRDEAEDTVNPAVHESQKEPATRMYDAMKDIIESEGNAYQDFDFRIIVPNRRYLEDQMIDRLTAFAIEMHVSAPSDDGDKHFFNLDWPEHDAKEGKERVESVRKVMKTKVVRACLKFEEEENAEGSEKYRLAQDLKEREDTLFLLIHDECHWGIAKGGAITSILLNEEIVTCSNFLSLHISATPWDFMTEGMRQTHHVKLTPSPDYRGIAWYGRDNVDEMVADCTEELDIRAKRFARNDAEAVHMTNTVTADANSKTAAIILDYAQCIIERFVHNAGIEYRYATAETRETVRQILPTKQNVPELDGDRVNMIPTPEDIQPGKMATVVIRMQRNSHAKLMEDVLRKVRAHLGMDSLFMVYADPPPSIADYKKERGKFVTFDTDLKEVGDKESIDRYLNHVPCIKIIVEKGRMGETFCDTFAAYDLRLRYQKITSQNTATAFEQDVGRAFGYRHLVTPGGRSPKLLMSRGASSIMREDPAIISILKPSQFLEPVRDPLVQGENGGDNPGPRVGGGGNYDGVDGEGGEGGEEEEEEDDHLDGGLEYWHRLEYEMDQRAIRMQATTKSGIGGFNTKKHFVLRASPQVGKTGTALWLLKLMDERFRSHTREFELFTRRMQKVATREEAVDKLRGKANDHAYLNYQKMMTEGWRDADERDGPERSAVFYVVWNILKHLQDAPPSRLAEYRQSPLRIADLGCGPARSLEVFLRRPFDQTGLPEAYRSTWNALTTDNCSYLIVDNFDIVEGQGITFGNILDDEFKDGRENTYDIVVLSFAIYSKSHHIALRNAYRILKADKYSLFVYADHQKWAGNCPEDSQSDQRMVVLKYIAEKEIRNLGFDPSVLDNYNEWIRVRLRDQRITPIFVRSYRKLNQATKRPLCLNSMPGRNTRPRLPAPQ